MIIVASYTHETGHPTRSVGLGLCMYVMFLLLSLFALLMVSINCLLYILVTERGYLKPACALTA